MTKHWVTLKVLCEVQAHVDADSEDDAIARLTEALEVGDIDLNEVSSDIVASAAVPV